MCAFCVDKDHEPVGELDEFTRHRYARMSLDEMWGEFQQTIADYNERNREAAER